MLIQKTMNVFPVSNSTLHPFHIAGFVKRNYQLEGDTVARILKTGISDTYLVTAGCGRYIFRVYSLNWRTEKEIAAEIELVNRLKENDLPVSYALPDKASNYIQHLQAPEGWRFGVLFSFAKGGKMLNIPVDLHRKLGTIMGRMHKVTHELQLERTRYTPQVLLEEPFERLLEFLPAGTEEMIYMASLKKYLLAVLNKSDKNQLRKGMVHLDIWFDNISIDDDDITVFDFDFCGNGWLVLDIAYYILQLYSTEKDEQEFNLKKESFLAGYASVNAITKEEQELVPAAAVCLYFFYLGVQCRRFDNWSNVFLNEIYLKRFINLLIKKWVNFHELRVA